MFRFFIQFLEKTELTQFDCTISYFYFSKIWFCFKSFLIYVKP